MDLKNIEIQKRLSFWEEYADDWKSKIYGKDNFNNFFREDSLKTIKEYFYKGEYLLDYGCGPGTQLLPLKREGYNVCGVDFSKKTIANLLHQDSTAKVYVAEGSDLPFHDNSFGGLYSIFAILSMTPDYTKCFKEISRILKPGGKFLIRTRTKYRLSEIRNFYRLIRERNSGEDKRKYRRGFKLYEHRFSLPELNSLCEQNNLKITQSTGLQAILGELQYYDIFRINFISKLVVPVTVKIDKWIGNNKLLKEIGLGVEIRGVKNA